MRYFISFMIFLGLPLSASAVTKKDMLGTWECVTAGPNSSHKTVTLDTMNADGSMYQLWEIVHYADDNKTVNLIEIFNIKNNWDLKNDKQVIKNWQLLDYRAYARDKRPLYNDEAVEMLKQRWVDVYKADYDDKVYMAKDKRSFYYEPTNGVIVSRCQKLS
ncbi:MAG: hypothetical protein ACTTHX_04010 [Moraxella sp.]